MQASNLSSSHGFDEAVKTNSVTLPTYLGRLLLRTHHEDDTASCAKIFSDSFSRQYLRFLQPPNGWGDDEERKNNKQWTIQDFTDRVNIQCAARANGKSCVLNMILLASRSGEKNDRCIGTTGFVTIENNIGYLGIITERNTTRMGYATEALYTSIGFAFEKLGMTEIIMQTDERNQEMRGWCEKTAGIELSNKKQMDINGYTFIQCEYSFTLDDWNSSVKRNLENKMNAMNTSAIVPLETTIS